VRPDNNREGPPTEPVTEFRARPIHFCHVTNTSSARAPRGDGHRQLTPFRQTKPQKRFQTNFTQIFLLNKSK